MNFNNQLTEMYGKWLLPIVPLLLFPEIAYAHSPPIFILAPSFAGPFNFIALSFVVAKGEKYKGKRLLCWFSALISVVIGYLTLDALFGLPILLAMVLPVLLIIVVPWALIMLISHDPNK